jgi:hypothetical protein
MFEDEFSGNIQENQLLYNFNDLDAYKRKVEQYLKEQSITSPYISYATMCLSQKVN